MNSCLSTYRILHLGLAASLLLFSCVRSSTADPLPPFTHLSVPTTDDLAPYIQPIFQCANFSLVECLPCPCKKLGDFAIGQRPVFTRCQDIHTCKAGTSLIDNIGLNYIHYAWDYQIDNDTAPSCASCGSSGAGVLSSVTDTGNAMPSFKLQRIHRYREQHIDSSFGPGAFTQFDTKIFLFEAEAGTNLIDVFDPALLYTQRFADGPYEDPHVPGVSTDDVLDGVYVSYRTNMTREIRLFDDAGDLTVALDDAVRAELLTHEGLKFHFEVFELNGGLMGRLTRIENRNEYAYEITYKFLIDDNLGRQWQIDTITDAYNRTATFSYHDKQVAGRWVVSKIELPNEEQVLYFYTDDFLSLVQHPDGTKSTVAKSFDNDTGCNVIEIFDAAAEATHRKKKVFLTSSIRYLPTGNDEIIAQSEGMVRMVANGDDEVSYFNYPGPLPIFPLVYEGPGRLKKISLGGNSHRVRFAKQWSISLTKFGTWFEEGIDLQLEATSEKYSYPDAPNYLSSQYRYEPSRIEDVTGRFIDYDEYDKINSAIVRAVHPDGTEELYKYNEFRQITQYVDRINRVTQHTYDARGNMLSRTVGLMLVDGEVQETEALATWEWQYYPQGHANEFLLQKAVDANGNETDYIYDADNFLVRIIEPPDTPGDMRAVQLLEYDDAGRLDIATDAENRETQFFYDERSRVIQIEFDDGSSERFFFGSDADANLVVERHDRNGNIWMMEHDATGRMTRRVEAVNDPSIAVETVCTYLAGTALRDTCVEKGEKTTYTYDYRHRLVERTVQPRLESPPDDPVELTTKSQYSRNLLIATTDPYGRDTFYGYDDVDTYLLRTIQETVPGHFPDSFGTGDQTDLFNTDREFVNNARYLIEDRVVDAQNQLLTRIDGRNIEHTSAYDAQGRMTETVIAASNPAVSARTEYEYDPQGNVTQLLNPRHFTEPGGFITAFTYTGRNLLKTKTKAVDRPEEATMSYTYYLDQTVDTTTDYRENPWRTIWETCCRRVQAQRDPNGSGSISNPDFYGNIAHTAVVEDLDVGLAPNFHDPIGVINEVTTRFDARHRPVARTVWLVDLGAVDPNDVPIAGDGGIDESDGLTTQWEYDDDLTDGVGIDADFAPYMGVLNLGPGSDGYGVVMTNPEIENTVTIYDGVGRVVLVIDGNGNATRTDYDAVVSINAFHGGDDPGVVLETAVVDPLDHITRSRSDGAGRVLQAVDEQNEVTALQFDNNSNRVRVRDPNDVGLDCVFDDRDRDMLCTDTVGDTTAKEYDAESNVTAYIDGLGNSTTCIYDPRNRKKSTTSRVDGDTTYTYDGNNNVLTIEDADGGETEYEYEQRNLKTKETFADDAPGDRGFIEYEYDGARRLTKRTDQKEDVTDFVYDRANRLLARTYPDDLDDVFTYDRASRLLTATSKRYKNMVTRAYDDASRLTSKVLNTLGQNYLVQYGYDEDDRKTQITYPDGSVVMRDYTARDQLANVKLDDQDVITCTYDPGLRLTSTEYGNGLTETRTYFADNLIKTIEVPGVTSFTYDYDPNKRRTDEANGVDPLLTQDYDYDEEDRLTNWLRQDRQMQHWQLTAVGDWDNTTINGVPQVRDHNPVHELTQINGTPLTYDPKGNLTLDTNAHGYAWDFDNQMATTDVPDADTLDYTYDALGRRVSKSVTDDDTTTTTIFVCDGAQVIAEYAGAVLLRKYLYATYIDDVCLMVRASDGAKSFYHRDSIYNTRVITNNAGSIVETYSYTPYGEMTIRDSSGNVVAQSTVGNPFGFQGHYHDDETDNDFVRARYYDPRLGRFVGRDAFNCGMTMVIGGRGPSYSTGAWLDVEGDCSTPMGIWHDFVNLGNGYGYVGNNPVTWFDPTGLASAADLGPLTHLLRGMGIGIRVEEAEYGMGANRRRFLRYWTRICGVWGFIMLNRDLSIREARIEIKREVAKRQAECDPSGTAAVLEAIYDVEVEASVHHWRLGDQYGWFAHCYVACVAAKEFNGDVARVMQWLKEIYDFRKSDSAIDDYYAEIGISCARIGPDYGYDCRCCCNLMTNSRVQEPVGIPD